MPRQDVFCTRVVKLSLDLALSMILNLQSSLAVPINQIVSSHFDNNTAIVPQRTPLPSGAGLTKEGKVENYQSLVLS